MSDTDPFAILQGFGGLAYADAAGAGHFAAIPIDGEWVTGHGAESLDHVVAMILASDGLAGNREGVQILPHLTADDCLAYAEEEGYTRRLVAGPALATD